MNDDIRTIAEYRAAAENTGEWEGTVVDFSLDGETWAPYILPTDGNPHPVLARAIVQRKERGLVETIILWDESIPDDDFAEVWERRPHLLFGAAVERAALRRTFPAALAGLAATDREQWTATPPSPASEPVNWVHEIAHTESVVGIDALHKTMRAQRVFTPDEDGIYLERLLKERRKQLVQQDAERADEAAGEG